MRINNTHFLIISIFIFFYGGGSVESGWPLTRLTSYNICSFWLVLHCCSWGYNCLFILNAVSKAKQAVDIYPHPKAYNCISVFVDLHSHLCRIRCCNLNAIMKSDKICLLEISDGHDFSACLSCKDCPLILLCNIHTSACMHANPRALSHRQPHPSLPNTEKQRVGIVIAL